MRRPWHSVIGGEFYKFRVFFSASNSVPVKAPHDLPHPGGGGSLCLPRRPFKKRDLRMWVKNISGEGLRCFPTFELQLSKGVNVIVGPNNAGKSTLLRPLLSLQDRFPQLLPADIREGDQRLTVTIELGWAKPPPFLPANLGKIRKIVGRGGPSMTTFTTTATGPHRQESPLTPFPGKSPDNFIYLFGAKRKVTDLVETINADTTDSVMPNFQFLVAKVDKLCNPGIPACKYFMDACERILGLRITTSGSPGGKQAVYMIDNFSRIPLSQMGEGVMSLVAILADLSLADDKLFIIEEPENDLHPRALKGLLDVIVDKAKTNQFLITTHSNVVLRRLGGIADAKVFRVCQLSPPSSIPTAEVREVERTTEARHEVLDELGYELADDYLWSAWLFLEESSAEKIIREYLIPWFLPDLSGRVRTFSAGSLSKVEPRFDTFNDLICFLNLEPVYRNKAWVIVDGGETESEILRKLVEKYHGWNRGQFRQLAQHDFEKYYPQRFEADATSALSLLDKREKREAKRVLLAKVEEFIRVNEEVARNEFQVSAAEVITILQEIQSALARQP